MKKMKRFVSALLAICLIVVMIPVTVSAAESGTCGENLTWTLSDDGVLTISGTGEMATYTYSDAPWYNNHSSIKKVVIEEGVTSIGDDAFENCDAMCSIVIPNSVTYIGERAFSDCYALTSVTIPDSVTSIGYATFYECDALTTVSLGSSVTIIDELAFAYCDALTSITIPASVTSIRNYAFLECKALTGIVIPDSVTSIGREAFAFCESLINVTIGSSVTSIGSDAFYSCKALTGIDVDENNTRYSSDSHGVLFNKEKTKLIQAPAAYQGHYSVPDTVTSIGDSAFSYCKHLTVVTLPDSVSSIDFYAFSHCDSLIGIYVDENNACYSSDSHGVLFNKNKTELLQSPGGYQGHYSVPDTVTSIGDSAFFDCVALTNVTIPSSVTSIGYFAFDSCDVLNEIFFCGNAPSIGYYAFCDVTATAYYPKNNSTWTSSIMQNYGGKLTWVPYEVEDPQPEAPTVKASNIASSGKIKVTWDKVEGAAKYKVYRATSKTGTYKLMKTVTGTSFTNTSVDAGKTYYYYVRAVDVDGNTSDKSNIVSRTCDLARPELTMSNVASSGKIKVSWKAIDGAVEYEVYRATSKTGTYKLVKTTTSTSFTNTSTTAGKTYYYKVKAIASKSAADSAYSEVKSRTCDLARPTASVALSSNKPKVSWKKVDGAVEYEVYRATSKSGTYSKVKTTTSLSYKDTKATSGKTYYYKVIAVASKSAANSTYSSVVSIKSK